MWYSSTQKQSCQSYLCKNVPKLTFDSACEYNSAKWHWGKVTRSTTIPNPLPCAGEIDFRSSFSLWLIRTASAQTACAVNKSITLCMSVYDYPYSYASMQYYSIVRYFKAFLKIKIIMTALSSQPVWYLWHARLICSNN